jgi:hypothetical protein
MVCQCAIKLPILAEYWLDLVAGPVVHELSCTGWSTGRSILACTLYFGLTTAFKYGSMKMGLDLYICTGYSGLHKV